MAQNKFYEIAEQALGVSPIMAGRDKISMGDVIEKYPEGILINGFDIISNDKGGYAVFTFKEEPKRYINGGALLTKMAFDWLAAFDGNIEKASDELSSFGGIRVRLYTKKTKRGNTMTMVEIVR